MNWNDKICIRWCCRWVYFRKYDEHIGYRNSTFLTYRQTLDASLGYGKNTYMTKATGKTQESRKDPSNSRTVWIDKYGQHSNVQRWLRQNPPPKDWPESPEAYAYREMPIWVLAQIPIK